MSEKFAVIGSNSFSGSSLIKSLIGGGHQVLGFSRSSELAAEYLPYRWVSAQPGSFKFVQSDINADTDTILEALDNFRPRYIINFAAQGMVAESWDHPEDWYTTNIVGQVRLVEKLKTFDFYDKFIQFTTPEVYGNTTGWITEEQGFNPTTPYAVSRACFDTHLKNMHDAYDFPVVFTRAANVFGEGQQLYRIVPRAVLSMFLGEKFPLHGNGASERAFIHIDDVSRAIEFICESGRIGESYHISTNETLTIRNLVETICQQHDLDIENVVDIAPERLGKDQAYKLDSSKLLNETGWQAEIQLDEGLTRVAEWVKRNLDTLKTHPRNYRHKRS
jgi:dTDP-glucose 4,6-dehydratase